MTELLVQTRGGFNAKFARASLLLEQRMPLGQLAGMPSREPMSNRFLADLILRHGRDDVVVNQQAIHVQRLLAC